MPSRIKPGGHIPVSAHLEPHLSDETKHTLDQVLERLRQAQELWDHDLTDAQRTEIFNVIKAQYPGVDFPMPISGSLVMARKSLQILLLREM